MESKRSGKGAKLDGWREKVSHKEFHYVAHVLGLKDNLLCVYHCAAFDSLGPRNTSA